MTSGAREAMERAVDRLSGVATRIVPRAAAVALALLIGAFPLFQGKLFDGHDATEYPPRLVEFHRNIAAGWLAPAWAPDLGHGHGQPLFLFSPPLYLWTAELAYAAGARIASALAFGALVFYALGALGAYRAGREAWRTRDAGLVTAVAFALSAHLLLDLYVRVNFNELAATALLPWVAYGLLRAGRARAGRDLLPLAFAVAGVALCHVGLLLVTAGWIALVALGWTLARRRWRPLIAPAASGLLGLALSAYFLLPALWHMGDTKAHLLRQDFLAYDRHFVEPAQLLLSPWGYGVSVPGPGDGMSFAVGLPHLLATLAALALLVAGRRRRGGRERWLALILAAATLAFALGATALSAPLWARLAPLQYLAYPWRLLALVSLGLALGAGALFARPVAWRPPQERLLLLVVVIALAVWAYPRARPQQFLTFDDEFYEPARIAAQKLETTTRREYEPRWIERRAEPSDAAATVLAGDATDSAVVGDPWDRRLRVRSVDGAELALHVHFFPGWRLWVDGRPLDPRIERGAGRIVVDVAPGESEIRVAWRDTAARRVGKAVSLIAILATGMIGRRAGARALPAAGRSRRRRP